MTTAHNLPRHGGLLLAVALLGGCATTISTAPGPNAADPACATVILSLPDEVLGQERAQVTAQGTAAWGEPQRAVVVTCGVEQPAPTQEDCQSITTDTFGVASTVDWIATTDNSGWIFTTYGRNPAVMVQVPQALKELQPTGALVDVAGAVTSIEQTEFCR